MKFHLVFCFSLLLSLVAGNLKADTAERHYLTLFAYQGHPNLARSAHTFATFIKVISQRDETEEGEVTESTISWLPAEGGFGPDHQMPVFARVAGHNYDLDETLELSRAHVVQTWGPYEITPEFYQKGIDRVNFLNSGRTDYKMIVLDMSLRAPSLHNLPGGAINCIMGVSDTGGYLATGMSWGFAATQEVLAFFRRSLVEYPKVHTEVANLIHLSDRLARTGHDFRPQ
jgi:hypothetical protein